MTNANDRAKRIFVAGTDTDIGKTWVAAQLMREVARAGLRVQGLKPVAAGGIQVGESGRGNEDALLLQSLSTTPMAYEQVNPLLFSQPIAPHIAALREGKTLSVDVCVNACQSVLNAPADLLVVEGAGGWSVPLNNRESMADLAVAMECSVLLVVGMKLGCISHALLTYSAIKQAGLAVDGWVANIIDQDMLELEENINTLTGLIHAPKVATIPYGGEPEESFFNLDTLLHGV